MMLEGRLLPLKRGIIFDVEVATEASYERGVAMSRIQVPSVEATAGASAEDYAQIKRAQCPKARSSLVRRIVQAENDPAKRRMREWLANIDDERLSNFGLVASDIAALRNANCVQDRLHSDKGVRERHLSTTSLIQLMRLTIVFAVIAALTGFLVAYADRWWDQAGSLPASATEAAMLDGSANRHRSRDRMGVDRDDRAGQRQIWRQVTDSSISSVTCHWCRRRCRRRFPSSEDTLPRTIEW
jgi:hypothetical protein